MRMFAERGATSLTVSELAEAAGVARGTVYNNVRDPDALFREVVAELASEMYDRVNRQSEGVTDPAERVSLGMRLFVRRAQEEPDWGRFIIRFSTTEGALQRLLNAQPGADIRAGIESGRFRLGPADAPSAGGLVSGLALSAMLSVLTGEQGWRTAGTNAAYFALVALGLDTAEAEEIAARELPDWPASAPPR